MKYAVHQRDAHIMCYAHKHAHPSINDCWTHEAEDEVNAILMGIKNDTVSAGDAEMLLTADGLMTECDTHLMTGCLQTRSFLAQAPQLSHQSIQC